MTYEEIISNLQKKIYHPIYLLMGQETYFIDRINDYSTGHALTDGAQGFKPTVLYRKGTEPDAIMANARPFPMM